MKITWQRISLILLSHPIIFKSKYPHCLNNGKYSRAGSQSSWNGHSIQSCTPHGIPLTAVWPAPSRTPSLVIPLPMALFWRITFAAPLIRNLLHIIVRNPCFFRVSMLLLAFFRALWWFPVYHFRLKQCIRTWLCCYWRIVFFSYTIPKS